MKNLYDVVIIGGGPAGLTAALYLARARYRVVVVEKEQFGGQITITSEVVNYPGVARTSGSELTDTMRRQAASFGAEFLLTEVTRLEMEGDIKKVHTGRGVLSCFGVLLATGAHPRMVGFEGEEAFRGHGVAYCATCDGEFFTGKEVFVVGGGFAAAEESVFLTNYAKHVTILIRGEDFSCARATAEAARNHEKITVQTNAVVKSVRGDTALRELRWTNKLTGEETVYTAEEGDTFGVFVFAGYTPATELIRGIAALNEQGYVITDANQKTTMDGLYAAGDVCIKSLRQVITAAGDGALAATALERYAADMQKKTGLKPEQPAAAQVRQAAGTSQSGTNTSPANASAARNMSGAGSANGTAAQNMSGTGSANSTAAQSMSGADTASGSSANNTAGSIFSPDIISQLSSVFSRMERPLLLRLSLDQRPVSRELRSYMEEMASLTDKLQVEILTASEEKELPCVQVCQIDGTPTGLAFHGVPGGHEFTSFVLGLYNAAGPGQALDEDTTSRIAAIGQPVNMQIMVSLSCTMCPELVTAAQRIAAANPLVSAEVFDLNHFPDRKEKYQIMSVPCLIINDKKPVFGKKNVGQLLDLIAAPA